MTSVTPARPAQIALILIILHSIISFSTLPAGADHHLLPCKPMLPVGMRKVDLQ
jgi:hypothetical protein